MAWEELCESKLPFSATNVIRSIGKTCNHSHAHLLHHTPNTNVQINTHVCTCITLTLTIKQSRSSTIQITDYMNGYTRWSNTTSEMSLVTSTCALYSVQLILYILIVQGL